jgi:hypothetical protein
VRALYDDRDKPTVVTTGERDWRRKGNLGEVEVKRKDTYLLEIPFTKVWT